MGAINMNIIDMPYLWLMHVENQHQHLNKVVSTDEWGDCNAIAKANAFFFFLTFLSNESEDITRYLILTIIK